MRRLIATTAGRLARSRLERVDDATFDALCDAALRGEMDFETVARKALSRAFGESSGNHSDEGN